MGDSTDSLSSKYKLALWIITIILISINGLILIYAIPETKGMDLDCDSSGCTYYARDFSAYYEGAWRLIHNPSMVYHNGNATGDYLIPPNPKDFRYIPFFLTFIIPFLALDYHNALLTFDLIQFVLLPFIAFFLYKIMTFTKQKLDWKSVLIFASVFIFALASPWSYYWQWTEGQCRVLETFLILWSIYGISKKSRFSGLLFALGSFDPRFTIISLPLAIYVAKKVNGIKTFVISAILSFFILYVGSLCYDGLAYQFYQSLLIHDNFIFYTYELIPLFTIFSSSLVVIFYNELNVWSLRVKKLGYIVLKYT
jgi:hypothetical protein